MNEEWSAARKACHAADAALQKFVTSNPLPPSEPPSVTDEWRAEYRAALHTYYEARKAFDGLGGESGPVKP